MVEQLHQSIDRLEQYIRRNNFQGYDPYDLLESPLFSGLPHKLKFVIQQLGRRSPVNFRPLFRVKKGYNPVSLGLCLQGYAYRFAETAEKKYDANINRLIADLSRLRSSGYHGTCWGYDFHWAARYTTIEAYSPNIVATGVITHALFEARRILKIPEAGDMLIDAVNFVEKDLNRTTVDNTLCFSYSPRDRQQVYNASMKAVRLLSQAYALTGEKAFVELAERAVAFVVRHQDQKGAWAYARGDARTWVDNYHTGYILDCLHEYRSLTKDDSVAESLRRGLQYYYDTFFYKGVIPKFRSDRIYPIDATGVAQSILTLSRFDYLDRALEVAGYAIREMQAAEGYFYFRRYKYYKNKISYMRWSNAWMFAALSYLSWRLFDERTK
ncbi:MAG TPA: hypothetical protein ENJ10_14140 [Caldithrix abyssi]|uniref:Non-reducing end beta-L-arabinofuranosidase-like GH127 catalytic domain-containing protein n=1 Tax=Caldithrix abyssi TaxID=187145 RepID=A0A7V1LPN4_CALAY|nr:hypothetical protein [Caldithrix abyssi]